MVNRLWYECSRDPVTLCIIFAMNAINHLTAVADPLLSSFRNCWFELTFTVIGYRWWWLICHCMTAAKLRMYQFVFVANGIMNCDLLYFNYRNIGRVCRFYIQQIKWMLPCNYRQLVSLSTLVHFLS